MSIIKPKRGTGSPAGSIETNEIAMDTAAKILYVSTNGTDAVNLADDTKTFLRDTAYFLRDYNQNGYPQEVVLGNNQINTEGPSNAGLVLKTGIFGQTSQPFRIDAVSLDLDGNPIVNVLDPVNAQEAATKNYVDTTSALNLPLAGGTMTGDIDMGDNDITNIKSLTLVDTVGTNGPMIIGQDQYSPNAIEILSDKSLYNGKSEIWYNFDNAGSKEYVGMQMWQADGGSAGSGDHYYRVASYKGSGAGNDVIIDSWKDHYTRLSNGFHDPTTRAPVGVLQLGEDKADLSYRLDIANGRTNSGSGLSPHALFIDTDMTQDLTVDLINSSTFNVSYGANTIRNGVQNAVTFSAENDALGSRGVGKFQAIYNANGYESKMRLQSINEAGSGSNAVNNGTTNTAGNGQIEVTAVKVASNVPYQLPQYTAAQLGAIPNPQEAMLVYNADTNKMAFYNGTAWTDL